MNQKSTHFHSLSIDTPLGSMLAIANADSLYLLEFHDRKNLSDQIKRLCAKIGNITPDINAPLESIKKELELYFNKALCVFQTPITMIGSSFDIQVWQELQKIPVHKTSSYKDLARKIAKPTAYRAVAQANGRNRLAIIVPCHRVIYQNGTVGGYAGGKLRKEWLLAHESLIR